MLEQLLPILKPLIEGLAGSNGTAIQVVLAVGTMRVLFKPLMVFLAAIAEATPSQKDNELLAKVQMSPVYKAVAFVLDYVASIKVPVKK